MPANNESRYAPTVWGAGENFKDFKTPSGQTCQIRIVSIEVLASEGLLDKLDVLTGYMSHAVIAPAQGKRPMDHQKKKPTKAEAADAEQAAADAQAAGLAKMMMNPAEFMPVIDMINKVVEYVVIQPTVRRPVEEGVDGVERPIKKREAGVVYTDVISLEDRLAIFGTSFSGLNDAVPFRDESEAAVGNLEDE